jgi:hypothetical protein
MEAALQLSAMLPFLQGRHVVDHSLRDRELEGHAAYLPSGPAPSSPRTSSLKRPRQQTGVAQLPRTRFFAAAKAQESHGGDQELRGRTRRATRFVTGDAKLVKP